MRGGWRTQLTATARRIAASPVKGSADVATPITIPPLLTTLIGHLAAAVPARARTTFTELLVGAATTRERPRHRRHPGSRALARLEDLLLVPRVRPLGLAAVWAALLEVLTALFRPAVWYAVIDDSVVERISARAPGSLIHHNHNAKPNRPRFLRGQGWLCLAAVVERKDWKVGAVPLLLRLVRRGANRGKLRSARFLLHLLGHRLGQVRLLLDAWFMRAWLILAAVADGHTVIGWVRRDLALLACPSRPASAGAGGRASTASG